MDSLSQRAAALKQQIIATEKELNRLKSLLTEVEETQAKNTTPPPPPQAELISQDEIRPPKPKWPLSSEEYKRYGRQMIVPNVGIQGIYFLPAPSLPYGWFHFAEPSLFRPLRSF
jgi:adenylyltransferase/sulfurtransferase